MKLESFGLNSLGAPARTAKAAPGTPASSFGAKLGQVSAESENPERSPTGKEPTTKEQLQAQSVEANALPSQPSGPSLSGPIMDRVMGAPTGVNVFNPLEKSTAPAATEDAGVDSLTRRVVWNDFLRKMKDDLGVSAEDVLSAFASLSDQDLAAPPAETVDKVVMALGLNGQDAQLAKKYFQDLVSKTKSPSMGDELAASQKQINLTLMSQRELQRKALGKSIDQLNQNFFNPQRAPKNQQGQMPAAAPMPAMDPLPAMNPNGPLSSEGMDAVSTEDAMRLQMGLPLAPLPGQEVVPQTIAPQAVAHAVQAQPQAQTKIDPKLLDNMRPAKQQPANTVDEMVRQFLMPQAAPTAAAPPPAEAAAPAAPQVAAPQVAAPQVAAMPVAGLNKLLSDLTAGDGDEDSEFTSDASYMAPTVAQDARTNAMTPAFAKFQNKLGKAGSQSPVQIPELVDRAQIMIKDGGGEMKVTLSPDGLGEVAMRVSVEHGKVNVQMVTESDEAKKLIERELGDLKAHLQGNHLQVDSIKIDTATNLGKQLEQQYQDAQRQMAQQTLEQFRQDHQGWRRSFFDVPAAKQFRGQGDANRDVAVPVSSSARKSGGNRRLDLVA